MASEAPVPGAELTGPETGQQKALRLPNKPGTEHNTDSDLGAAITEAAATLEREIWAAHARGHSIRTLARLTGKSRQAITAIVKGAPPAPKPAPTTDGDDWAARRLAAVGEAPDYDRLPPEPHKCPDCGRTMIVRRRSNGDLCVFCGYEAPRDGIGGRRIPIDGNAYARDTLQAELADQARDRRDRAAYARDEAPVRFKPDAQFLRDMERGYVSTEPSNYGAQVGPIPRAVLMGMYDRGIWPAEW